MGYKAMALERSLFFWARRFKDFLTQFAQNHASSGECVNLWLRCPCLYTDMSARRPGCLPVILKQVAVVGSSADRCLRDGRCLLNAASVLSEDEGVKRSAGKTAEEHTDNRLKALMMK